MGLTAALIAFTAISATGSIVQGIQQNRAAKAEADLLEEQGLIQQEEAVAEAQRIANDRRKFRKKQKIAFIKNGVTLAGSPLLVLEETRRESQEEVDAIVRRGRAQAALAFQQAALTRGSGRAALLGGIFGAATSLAIGGFLGAKAGIFSKSTSTAANTSAGSLSGALGPQRTSSFLVR